MGCYLHCFRSGFPGAQPVSMDRQNLRFLEQSPYKVSWKADGTRYDLLLTFHSYNLTSYPNTSIPVSLCVVLSDWFPFSLIRLLFPVSMEGLCPWELAVALACITGVNLFPWLVGEQLNTNKFNQSIGFNYPFKGD